MHGEHTHTHIVVELRCLPPEYMNKQPKFECVMQKSIKPVRTRTLRLHIAEKKRKPNRGG